MRTLAPIAMAFATLCVLVGAAAPSADAQSSAPEAPPVTGMTPVADVAAACASLRTGLDARAPCKRIARTKVSGLGTAEVHAVKRGATVRYGLLIVRADKTWQAQVKLESRHVRRALSTRWRGSASGLTR
jgi:hypothetical protein